MNTTIYLIRHSEPTKIVNNGLGSDSLQVCNEKNILSSVGEKKAEKLSQIEEMQNIDLVISSNYVRAMSTAKYIAEANNVSINVIDEFGERKFGIDDWCELPENFGVKQIENPDFKIKNGECQREVAKRMYDALLEVLKENKGKRIAIISHATAITFLLMKLGVYKDKKIYFNDDVVVDENFKWKAPEVFKFSFKDDKLMLIENININF